jgi:hypothetical protein
MNSKKVCLIFIIIVSFIWFPHSLNKNCELGYCFPIYYQAGQENLVDGWVYNDLIGYIFYPFAKLPFDLAFGLWYSLCVLAWISIAWRWPLAGIIGAYPILLALQIGQIDPILAWLCLTPIGAILAACVKPYCVLFVVFHAFRIKKRYSSGLL